MIKQKITYKINYLKFYKNHIYSKGGADRIIEIDSGDSEEISTKYNFEIASDINKDVVEILEQITNTQNVGQENCGILPYKKYILKCPLYNSYQFPKTLNNSIRLFFPQYYLWPDHHFFTMINGHSWYIMERLDGDLTKYILEQSYISKYGQLNNEFVVERNLRISNGFKFYYEFLPRMTNRTFPFKLLNEKGTQIFNDIKENVKPHIKNILNKIQKKIIELHHNLIINDYIYKDLNLDNFAYKIVDGDIKFYFIDGETLQKIDTTRIFNVKDHVVKIGDKDKQTYEIINFDNEKAVAIIRLPLSQIFKSQIKILYTFDSDTAEKIYNFAKKK